MLARKPGRYSSCQQQHAMGSDDTQRHVRLSHLADSMTGLAARPLSGVTQTFPVTDQLMLIYEYTP